MAVEDETESENEANDEKEGVNTGNSRNGERLPSDSETFENRPPDGSDNDDGSDGFDTLSFHYPSDHIGNSDLDSGRFDIDHNSSSDDNMCDGDSPGECESDVLVLPPRPRQRRMYLTNAAAGREDKHAYAEAQLREESTLKPRGDRGRIGNASRRSLDRCSSSSSSTTSNRSKSSTIGVGRDFEHERRISRSMSRGVGAAASGSGGGRNGRAGRCEFSSGGFALADAMVCVRVFVLLAVRARGLDGMVPQSVSLTDTW